MDLLLDEKTHDMVFSNGATPVTTTPQITVAQRLKIRLQTFQGEYFMNLQAGVPYYQRIFGKIKNKSTIDTIFQSEILADEGVIELVDYQSTLDNTLRFLTVTFSVRTSDGITDDISITVGE